MSERFQVDLRGIIELAANHLYTTPEVFVRELIQNAVDAVTARRRLEPGFEGRIRLELTRGSGEGEGATPATLSVSDDGIGLTPAEVREFLSTVGGSSKREDAEKLAEGAAEEGDAGFLGRFGIGLLSCFMVTDEIVVVTRSAREAGAPAVEWRGRADGSYSVRELPRSVAAGTSVHVRATEAAQEHFEPEALLELARRYAEMLRVPIVVSTGGGAADDVRVNVPTPAWELAGGAADEVALSDLCQERLEFRPIDQFELRSEAGKVRGWAFVRPDRGSQWGGSHRLYSRGMFVSEHAHGLLPRWATFIGCVLNTDGLRLTASRESVHRDATLEAAAEALGAAIRGRLGRLLRHDPERFAAVMAVHDVEIRGLAVRDAEFFEIIADLLEFETTLGRVRFGEFRREHERVLLARTAEQFRRVGTVAEAAGLRVFNGGYTYHEELLVKAVARHPELTLEAFDVSDLVDELAEPADPGSFERLLASAGEALGARRCEPVVRDFAPAGVAAVYALGLDAELHRQIDRTKRIASGLWNEVLETMAPRPADLPPTRLCLNARNPLVRALSASRDGDLVRTGVEVLYVHALMDGQHPLTGDEQALLSAGLLRLLSLAAQGSGRDGGVLG